jgi:hypothetical protein
MQSNSSVQEADEEFNKLYHLLSSLAKKSTTNPAIIPEISLQSTSTKKKKAEKPIEEKPPIHSAEEYNQLYAIVASLSKKIPPKPTEEPVVQKYVKQQCKGCLKWFATAGSLSRHHDRFEACRNGTRQTIETNNKPHIPIYNFVHDCVDKAISGKRPYQCRFCQKVYTSNGNLRLHLHNAISCNRLAYIEFKKLFDAAM